MYNRAAVAGLPSAASLGPGDGLQMRGGQAEAWVNDAGAAGPQLLSTQHRQRATVEHQPGSSREPTRLSEVEHPRTLNTSWDKTDTRSHWKGKSVPIDLAFAPFCSALQKGCVWIGNMTNAIWYFRMGKILPASWSVTLGVKKESLCSEWGTPFFLYPHQTKK